MTRDESLKILNSVYEDIKNMTEEDIENFNNTIRKYDKGQKMTDREVKEHLIFNPETGISEDGTMHDCVYRPRINQPKQEKKMTDKVTDIIVGNIDKEQAFKIVLEKAKKEVGE